MACGARASRALARQAEEMVRAKRRVSSDRAQRGKAAPMQDLPRAVAHAPRHMASGVRSRICKSSQKELRDT